MRKVMSRMTPRADEWSRRVQNEPDHKQQRHHAFSLATSEHARHRHRQAKEQWIVST
jgi:hypothetical protein